jgi:hypothetical protein
MAVVHGRRRFGKSALLHQQALLRKSPLFSEALEERPSRPVRAILYKGHSEAIPYKGHVL